MESKIKMSSNRVLIKLLVDTNFAPKLSKIELYRQGKWWRYKTYGIDKAFLENPEWCIILEQKGVWNE